MKIYLKIKNSKGNLFKNKKEIYLKIKFFGLKII